MLFTATYINMQDAFATEKNNVGDWAEIGYSGPGAKTNNSSYQTENFLYTGASTIASKGSTTSDAWQATARNKLNDCNSGSWHLSATYLTSGNNEGNVAYTATADAGCGDLTPSFAKLSNGLGS